PCFGTTPARSTTRRPGRSFVTGPLPSHRASVSRRAELLALLLIDAAALNAAYALFYVLCRRYDWLDAHLVAPGSAEATALALCAGWLVLFLLAGMYQERFAASRFDELVTLLKVTLVGALLLFFGVFIDRATAGAARLAIGTHWGAGRGVVAVGRLGVRAVAQARSLRGHGLHKAVVDGWSERDVARYPAAGLRIVGAVRLQHHGVPVRVGGSAAVGGTLEVAPPSGDGLPAGELELVEGGVHSIAELPALIDRLGVQDVLIALGPDDHAYLDEVLRVCDGKPVALKLVPDFYTAIGGMARTEHLYGLPLIEVLPEPIPTWEKSAERLIDIGVSALVLAAGLPLWLLVGVLVRLSSPGPAIYRQTRVGQHGRTFTMYKYRTMVDGAEAETGPVWAQKGDHRVTPLGRLLRRLRLDE